MSRIDNVIEDLKGCNTSWIYDNEGKIKDSVICGDVIPFLKELKEYEVELEDAEFEELANRIKEANQVNNSYNWNANISHDINYYWNKLNDKHYYLISVHRFGDARCNYSDEFIVVFDYENEMFELESVIQMKDIPNTSYVADIDIFCEEYNVYDYESGSDIGYFFEMEVDDLLKEIEARQENEEI